MSESACKLLIFSMILNYNYVIMEPLDEVAEYAIRETLNPFSNLNWKEEKQALAEEF